MDPPFKQWLCDHHNAPPKLLKKLEKEDIVNETTLSALTDTDLERLERQHKLPVGHMVVLRSSRDELRAKGGRRVKSRSRVKDDFEALDPPVRKETAQGSATIPPYPARLEDQQWQRPTGDEIRSKYQLPGGGRGSRYVPAPPRNGASAMPSATPSPLPDTARTPTPAGGAGGGLQAASQMRELHKKGVERGEKITVLEQKSRGLASTAMDYESICAQLAEKHRVGKKKKKKQKKKEKDTTAEDKKAASNHISPPSQQDWLSSSTPHTFPSSTHSPSSNLPAKSSTLTPSSPPPQTPQQHGGPHSDPIRHRSPLHTYGAIDIDRDRSRSATPTSFSYTSDDEKLHLHYDQDDSSPPPVSSGRGRSGGCPCCRTM